VTMAVASSVLSTPWERQMGTIRWMEMKIMDTSSISSTFSLVEQPKHSKPHNPSRDIPSKNSDQPHELSVFLQRMYLTIRIDSRPV
jgi:hypothetical protein